MFSDRRLRHNKGMSIRSYLGVFIALPALAWLAACGGGSTPTFPDQSSVPFSATELRAGGGVEGETEKTLTVIYAGCLYSATAADNKGSLFDTNVGRTPLTFLLGAG